MTKPVETTEIIKLRKQDLTFKEIGKRVGMSAPGVQRRYVRGKKKYPKKYCSYCGHLAQLDFDPLYEWRKSKRVMCPECKKRLFDLQVRGLTR